MNKKSSVTKEELLIKISQLESKISELEKSKFQNHNLSKSSNRKQTEEKLKESKELFELAMAATKDGLFDWNLITNEIYYSPGWKSMLGYKDEELANDFSAIASSLSNALFTR